MNYYNNARCVCPQPYGTLQYDYISHGYISRGIELGDQLLMAVKDGNIAEVNRLIEEGANVDYVDLVGYTPLMWASNLGSTAIVDLLIEKGANVNRVSIDGLTALQAAAMNGHRAIVDLLIVHRADVNSIGPGIDIFSNTPLMWASQEGHTDIVDRLLLTDADVNKVNSNGRGALSRAIQWGRIDVVDRLLHAGADAQIKDVNGRSLLQIAAVAHSNALATVDRMIMFGVNPHDQDQWGRTALMDAVKNSDVVGRLIDMDVDVNIQDENGNTALIYAVEAGNEESVALLLRKGADSQIRNNNGLNALEIANNPAIIELLRRVVGTSYYGLCYC